MFLAAANVKFIRERKSAFLWKQENAGEKKYLINQNESYTETDRTWHKIFYVFCSNSQTVSVHITEIFMDCYMQPTVINI